MGFESYFLRNPKYQYPNPKNLSANLIFEFWSFLPIGRGTDLVLDAWNLIIVLLKYFQYTIVNFPSKVQFPINRPQRPSLSLRQAASPYHYELLKLYK